MVTDLDTHLVGRALTSLGAELRRREHLLAVPGAKDLEDYEALRRNDPSLPTIPRLGLVIDEFASLKAELPDFVTGLVTIAQRGRSLGIHLILATQRPSGVVSADIRANTNLRIALRVTDESESRDVIDSQVCRQGRAWAGHRRPDHLRLSAPWEVWAADQGGRYRESVETRSRDRGSHGLQDRPRSDRALPAGHAMRATFLRRGHQHTSEAGSMAIEMVLLTPVLIAFILLIVAGGRLVGRQGDVDSAARDAARAASFERTLDSATAVGQAVAAASLPASFRDGTTCQPASVDTSKWQQGGSVGVTIQCQVSYSGLGLIGLPGSTTVKGNSVAPVDQYRRTQ
jgi:hypothetical protein